MRRIEDYALLGDLQTAALVHRTGSIDWCCFPRFDSGACFAALLGGPEHGRWLLAPAAEVRHTERRYRHDTLILETLVETAEGAVRVIDFMPPRGRAPDIVRIVEGRPRPRADALRADHPLRLRPDRAVGAARRRCPVAIAGPDALCLRTPVEIHGEDLTTVSEFTVEPGERVPVRADLVPLARAAAGPDRPRAGAGRDGDVLARVGASAEHDGEYHDEIQQSLLVLKALTYEPTGGIVAAPTTSLPERIGGVRNWDYRYCWLRDATLTLLAMLSAGYRDEALGLARVAAAGDRRRPGRGPDHVRHRRRAAARRSASSTGCRGSTDRVRCASATPPRRSCSSTSTARCWTPPTRPARQRRRRLRRTAGRCSSNCSPGWRTAGGRRMPGSGRCAVRTGTSRTPR